MKPTMIYKGLIAAAIMAVAIVSHQQVQAACGGGSVCCPKCKNSCKLKAEKVDVEKTTFEVESKTICIPNVVFPWQMPKKKSGCRLCKSSGSGTCRSCSSCINNGATTRTVRILKSKKYKCPECKYSWSAEQPSCSSCLSGKCSSGNCSSGNCGAGSGCSSGGCSAGSDCTGMGCDGCSACDADYSAATMMPQTMPQTMSQTMPTMEAPDAMRYEGSMPPAMYQQAIPQQAAPDYFAPPAP